MLIFQAPRQWALSHMGLHHLEGLSIDRCRKEGPQRLFQERVQRTEHSDGGGVTGGIKGSCCITVVPVLIFL